MLNGGSELNLHTILSPPRARHIMILLDSVLLLVTQSSQFDLVLWPEILSDLWVAITEHLSEGSLQSY